MTAQFKAVIYSVCNCWFQRFSLQRVTIWATIPLSDNDSSVATGDLHAVAVSVGCRGQSKNLLLQTNLSSTVPTAQCFCLVILSQALCPWARVFVWWTSQELYLWVSVCPVNLSSTLIVSQCLCLVNLSSTVLISQVLWIIVLFYWIYHWFCVTTNAWGKFQQPVWSGDIGRHVTNLLFCPIFVENCIKWWGGGHQHRFPWIRHRWRWWNGC